MTHFRGRIRDTIASKMNLNEQVLEQLAYVFSENKCVQTEIFADILSLQSDLLNTKLIF
jgi:hypothetical protein